MNRFQTVSTLPQIRDFLMAARPRGQTVEIRYVTLDEATPWHLTENRKAIVGNTYFEVVFEERVVLVTTPTGGVIRNVTYWPVFRQQTGVIAAIADNDGNMLVKAYLDHGHSEDDSFGRMMFALPVQMNPDRRKQLEADPAQKQRALLHLLDAAWLEAHGLRGSTRDIPKDGARATPQSPTTAAAITRPGSSRETVRSSRSSWPNRV